MLVKYRNVHSENFYFLFLICRSHIYKTEAGYEFKSLEAILVNHDPFWISDTVFGLCTFV